MDTGGAESEDEACNTAAVAAEQEQEYDAAANDESFRWKAARLRCLRAEDTVDSASRPVAAAAVAAAAAAAAPYNGVLVALEIAAVIALPLRGDCEAISETQTVKEMVILLEIVSGVPKHGLQVNGEETVTKAKKAEPLGASQVPAGVVAGAVLSGFVAAAAAVDCAEICGIHERPS